MICNYMKIGLGMLRNQCIDYEHPCNEAFLHSIFLIFYGFWKTYNTITDLQDIDNVDFDFFSCKWARDGSGFRRFICIEVFVWIYLESSCGECNCHLMLNFLMSSLF